jgi:hypothetical protein
VRYSPAPSPSSFAFRRRLYLVTGSRYAPTAFASAPCRPPDSAQPELHPTIALQDGYTARPYFLLSLDERCSAPPKGLSTDTLGAVAQTKRR